MSGHSKWATIKRKKALIDAKRGQAFTKLIRELSMTARAGGGNPDANPRLRVVMDKAREVNMPNDNIKRAIQRGTGEGADALIFEEATYEGYGPGGAAVIVDALTDSKNRTSSILKTIFTRHGGNMGEPGSVAWGFAAAGLIQFDRKRHDEDALMAAALEAGADDFRTAESTYDIVTAPAQFEAVRSALVAKGLQPTAAELVKLPKNTVNLEGKNAEAMVRLMEALEEHDDVQHVWSNFDISEKLLESLVGSGEG
jgi:YebC/PmpR family DNA-binding regulatory protein